MCGIVEWKPLLQNPNYWISSDGVVRNNITGKILAQHSSNGYRVVKFPAVTGATRSTSSQVTARVNRLVALTFLPNPEALPVVDHVDRDHCNNCVVNLRWASYVTNNNNHKSRYTVYLLSEDETELETYSDIKSAAAVAETSAGYFRRCITKDAVFFCRGKKWRVECNRDAKHIDYDEEIIKLSVWITVPFNTSYEASATAGAVRKKDSQKLLTASYYIYVDETGNKHVTYPAVSLSRIQIYLHLVIARTFGLASADKEINHLNGKLDARLTSLEAVTHSENMLHAYRTGLTTQQAPVLQYVHGKLLRRHPRQAEALRYISSLLGEDITPRADLLKAIKKNGIARGYYWMKADDPSSSSLEDCTHFTDEEVIAHSLDWREETLPVRDETGRFMSGKRQKLI